MGSKLTCATIDSANKRYATATSLDHVIAKQINPNAAAPAGALGRRGQHRRSRRSCRSPHRAPRFPATVNPLTVYNQLTGVFGTGSTGGTAERRTTGQAAYLVKRRQSVLDLCKADLGRYQSLKMSKADKTLVQNWMDLLRTTETGITPGMPTTMPTTMPTASCSKMTAESAPFNPTATMRERHRREPDRQDHAGQRPRQHARSRRRREPGDLVHQGRRHVPST